MNYAIAIAAALVASAVAPRGLACGSVDVRTAPLPSTVPTVLLAEGATLYTARADGSDWKLVSSPRPGEANNALAMMRSVDRQIVYLYRGQHHGPKHHHLLDLRTGRDLAVDFGPGEGKRGKLSPDGRWLAVWNDGLWLFDVEAEQRIRVGTPDKDYNGELIWSADATGVYLYSYEEGARYYRVTPGERRFQPVAGYASDGRIGFTRNGGPDQLDLHRPISSRPFPTQLPNKERWAEVRDGSLWAGGDGVPTRSVPLPGSASSKRCGEGLDVLGWASRDMLLVRSYRKDYAYDPRSGQARLAFPSPAGTYFEVYW
jgi:hypothetical protein